MENTNNYDKFNSKRKTTNNIKKINLLFPKSNSYDFLLEDNYDLTTILDDYQEINGIYLTESILKKKIKNRKSFVSQIPSPDKNCKINLGNKYSKFISKL